MTVTSPYLRGPVDDPHVAGGPVDDPRKTSYHRGPVDDPHVAGGLVDDPRKIYLRGLVDDPHVAGGLVDDPRDFLVDDDSGDDDALVNFLVDDDSGDDDALVTPSLSGLIDSDNTTFSIYFQDNIEVFVIPQLRKGIG